MRGLTCFRTAAAGALVICAACVRTASAASAPSLESVARIQVAGASGTTDGACVLVAIEERPAQTVQYFLTAAHLFSWALVGEHSTAAVQVTVTLPNGTSLRANGSHVLFPSGMESGVDVAVVSLVSASTGLVPQAVMFEAPDVGDLFTIRAPADLLLRDSRERVRFRSTRLVVGDRALLDASSVVGAPALSDKGVFGLTSTVGSNGIPIVSLLGAAREFLSRALPGLATRTGGLSQPAGETHTRNYGPPETLPKATVVAAVRRGTCLADVPPFQRTSGHLEGFRCRR